MKITMLRYETLDRNLFRFLQKDSKIELGHSAGTLKEISV